MGVNSPIPSHTIGPPTRAGVGDNVGSGQPSTQQEKEKACIIKMGGKEGVGGAGGEGRTGDRWICLCMRRGAERSPVTHGFGLEEQNGDIDKHIAAAIRRPLNIYTTLKDN